MTLNILTLFFFCLLVGMVVHSIKTGQPIFHQVNNKYVMLHREKEGKENVEMRYKTYRYTVIGLMVLLILSIALNIYIGGSKQTQSQNININLAEEKEKINLNKATLEELKSLPTIGEYKAKLIIENRPFESVCEIVVIEGIGEDTVDNIKGLVMLE